MAFPKCTTEPARAR